MSVQQHTAATSSDSGADGLIGRRGVCRFLGVSRWTLWNWRKRGYGPPFYKVGGRLFYKVRDLEKWLEARRQR